MEELLVTHRGTVYPWQCDHMGHMNVMWYVGKFDEASWQLLNSLGLTASRFRDDGIGMAAVEQRIHYKRELHAGDGLTIRSGVIDVTGKAIHILHELTHDESATVAASSVIVAVHIDATTRKARGLPADVRERAIRMVRERQAAGDAAPQGVARSAGSEWVADSRHQGQCRAMTGSTIMAAAARRSSRTACVDCRARGRDHARSSIDEAAPLPAASISRSPRSACPA